MKFVFKYIHDKPVLDALDYPLLGGNLNGPSLIRVPDWIKKPLGKYYLYFAHHEGKHIRLAYADELDGNWTVHEPGTLSLERSLFCQQAPTPSAMHPDVLASIAAGIDGDYPHIASPDLHIDDPREKIIMYYHGRIEDGTQQTRLAESNDGITFTPFSPLLGDSYFRVFQHRDCHYAIAWGSKLYRSGDGGYSFEEGPRLTQQNYRHGAILRLEESDEIYVIWSRAGDCPESLLISPIQYGDKPVRQKSQHDDWHEWRLGPAKVLHKPQRNWEGCNEPLVPSSYGGIMQAAHEIRDPCIYCEDDRIFLLYSIRGEQGIALGEISVAP